MIAISHSGGVIVIICLYLPSGKYISKSEIPMLDDCCCLRQKKIGLFAALMLRCRRDKFVFRLLPGARQVRFMTAVLSGRT